MEHINYPGVGVIKLRRGLNIKYLSIHIAPGRGIWINVPYGVSGAQIVKFLDQKREWIHRNASEIIKHEKESGISIKMGAEIRTKRHILTIENSQAENISYKIDNNRITLFIPEKTIQKSVEKIVKNFLLAVYRKECAQILPQRVKELAAQHGFTYRKLTFRNNVSNWGSCSCENNISLNIKLMKLSDEVVDYVILHELCHTVEKNHSHSFWKLMEKVCPDYKKKREILSKYNTVI